MNLNQFKDNIVTLKYIDPKIIDEQTFDIDEKHLSKVSKIASDIGTACYFTNEEITLTKIAALVHDMHKTKSNKKTHAKDASDLIDSSNSFQTDLGILFYEEFNLHFTPRMLTSITCAVRNHQKMDSLKENEVTGQMYKIALAVYAADKIDKFRKEEDYSDAEFDDKMKKAYNKISKQYRKIADDMKPTITHIKDGYKKKYANNQC